jgi:succinate dehydrogenase / fumarate reductase, cytochrome b subunit
MAEHPHGAAPKQRPLSPFVTIYRWPVTMFTSITHRVTGVALYAGMVLVAWWLIAATMGPEVFEPTQRIAASIIGRIVLFGFVWALTFHFLNGIRHLAWDIGYGFDVATANKTGVLVVTLSVLVAIALFVLATMQLGTPT